MLPLLLAAQAAFASIVLLDEYWVPEITANDVRVREVGGAAREDPNLARSGECSAELRNEAGWPNVRFRGAGMVKLSELPLRETEARLWYRTDAWAGTWRLELWVYAPPAGPGPVKVLQARLNGGADRAALIADDQWHQAKGRIEATEAYARVPQDVALAAYLWLVPESGWNLRHRTLIDRCELISLQDEREGRDPPAPATRVRPRPGAQVNAPPWTWFEGEDACEQNVAPGGPIAPYTMTDQKLLSNGAWLQGIVGPDLKLLWQIRLAESDSYSFWCRGNGTSFRWAWDDQPFGACTETSGWQDSRLFRMFPEGEFVVQWVRLGEVRLSAGTHLLQVQDLPVGEGFAFDCWLLTRQPFRPRGPDKPPG